MNKGKISLSTRIEVELSLGRCLFVFLYGWEDNGHFGPLIGCSKYPVCSCIMSVNTAKNSNVMM